LGALDGGRVGAGGGAGGSQDLLSTLESGICLGLDGLRKPFGLEGARRILAKPGDSGAGVLYFLGRRFRLSSLRRRDRLPGLKAFGRNGRRRHFGVAPAGTKSHGRLSGRGRWRGRERYFPERLGLEQGRVGKLGGPDIGS